MKKPTLSHLSHLVVGVLLLSVLAHRASPNAVNGIVRKCTPYFVSTDALNGAIADAVQAA